MNCYLPPKDITLVDKNRETEVHQVICGPSKRQPLPEQSRPGGSPKRQFIVPVPSPKGAGCPAGSPVGQIAPQLHLRYHASDTSGHEEITAEEKARNEVCTGLLINVGSLYLSYLGWGGVGWLVFLVVNYVISLHLDSVSQTLLLTPRC